MNKFAFITHPMDIEDMHRYYPLSQKTPDILIKKASKTLLPLKAIQVKDIKTPRGETQGYCIVIPLTLKQILTLPEKQVCKRIKKAGNVAKKLGVDIIGLGGGLSNIKEIASILEKELSIPVTTGQTYTMAAIIEGIKKIMASRKKDFKECEITIILDEDFPMGSQVAKYLASQAKYLTLVSHNKLLLESLYQEIFHNTGTAVHISDDIHTSIQRGDIIITSTIEDTVQTNNIKTKAIIWDLLGYKSKVFYMPKIRKDITIILDGIIKLPVEIDSELDFGFPDNTYCASMAEVILLAIEEDPAKYRHSQEIQLKEIDTIKQRAIKNNFSLIGVSDPYKDQIMF